MSKPKRGKRKVRYAPVFRPIYIEVIGIENDGTRILLPVAHPTDCGGANPQGDNTHLRVYVRLTR